MPVQERFSFPGSSSSDEGAYTPNDLGKTDDSEDEDEDYVHKVEKYEYDENEEDRADDDDNDGWEYEKPDNEDSKGSDGEEEKRKSKRAACAPVVGSRRAHPQRNGDGRLMGAGLRRCGKGEKCAFEI